MYVKRKMTANPYTISFDAPINEAIELMREKGIKRIPVMQGEKVVGMLTHVDIQTLSSPKATTLSVFELNYLLSKAKVCDAMTKEVITISPDALLEEAAVLMRENRISSLVVMENNKLVGIITESDIFDAFIDLLGFREAGSRITVEAADVPGAIATIGGIFSSFDANITHIAVYRGNAGKSDVVIRTNTINTDAIEKKLEENGYKVVHLIKSEK
jgi:acetoin utilization protein AcuB